VVRVPKAYPIYDADYCEQLAVVREWVDGLENLQTIGRNGLHRYDNQDHAMVTGMLAVKNLLRGEGHDLWSVNTEQDYHEEVHVPAAPASVLAPGFAKLDRTALGVATGIVAGLALMAATLVLLLRGGPVVGPNLALLGQYLPGYRVTPGGALLGLAYGLLGGFATGWTFAILRNATALFVVAVVRRQLEGRQLARLLDYV
jgi:hypothetical protein